jgi:hypothetical protein
VTVPLEFDTVVRVEWPAASSVYATLFAKRSAVLVRRCAARNVVNISGLVAVPVRVACGVAIRVVGEELRRGSGGGGSGAVNFGRLRHALKNREFVDRLLPQSVGDGAAAVRVIVRGPGEVGARACWLVNPRPNVSFV